MAKLPGSNASDLNSSTRNGATSKENQNSLLALLTCNAEQPRKMLKNPKKQKNTFFFYVTIEKAVQTICSEWTRDKAGRDVCAASGLFGKPGLHLLCVPSPFYPLSLRGFPAAFLCPGSAAPQHPSYRVVPMVATSLLEKKAQKEKKILSYLSGPQSGHTDPIFSCKDIRQLHL